MLVPALYVGPELVSQNAFMTPDRGISDSYPARQCTPADRLCLLLFAEIHGGSENKTGLSGFKRSSEARKTTSCPLIERDEVEDGLSLAERKQFRSPDASVGVKKNKPAEAPDSGDDTSRLSYTGTPATQTGRFPLSGISVILVLAPRLG